MEAAEEESLIPKGIDLFFKTIGKVPVGWYRGRLSPRTRSLLARVYAEKGLELLYFSDDYSDDLPFSRPNPAGKNGLLHVPYSLSNNDFRFMT